MPETVLTLSQMTMALLFAVAVGVGIRWLVHRSASGFRGTAMSVLLFLPIFIVLRHARPAGIILYQGTFLGFLISLAQFSVEHRRIRQVGEASKNALLTFLLIYSFVFTVPTTVDRAYSVRMLTRLNDSPSGLTHDEIRDVFLRGFLAEGGVDKRLIEQTSTGSIREHDGRYSLTSLGRFLSTTFRFTQVVFACRGRP